MYIRTVIMMDKSNSTYSPGERITAVVILLLFSLVHAFSVGNTYVSAFREMLALLK